VSTWIHSTTQPEWSDLFTGYQRCAYRLEARQVYSSPMEDAALQRWLAGEEPELDLTWTVSRTRAQLALGRTKTRVRVVVEPPTDYIRHELTVYPHLAAGGEEIRIIAVPEGSRPGNLPSYDYWLFDEREVWRMHYNDDHTFFGAERLDDPDAADLHLRWRDNALAQAVSLGDYLRARAGGS
jgi:hypothetical protein